MIDKDHVWEYSPIVSVSFDQIPVANSVPWPNPVKNGTIYIKTTNDSALQLLDLTGRSVSFSTRLIDKTTLEIKTWQQLQPGIYILVSSGNGYKLVAE